MNRFSTIVLLGSILATLPLVTQEQDKGKQDKGKQNQKDKIIVDESPESVARRDFMRSKLMYSQNIFEGLTTGDFSMIDRGVDDIRGITAAEQWVVIDDPRYQKLREEFATTVQRLADAAESENIDAVALRYYQMSTSCIDCHKHIRKVGYTF